MECYIFFALNDNVNDNAYNGNCVKYSSYFFDKMDNLLEINN